MYKNLYTCVSALRNARETYVQSNIAAGGTLRESPADAHVRNRGGVGLGIADNRNSDG